MSGFCVIHCTEQPVSQQLEKLTSSTKLNTLKDRITYFLAHDVSPFSELSFANKHLLDCEDVATTSVYYHNQCYVKFTHRGYLKDLKRPASQSVEELHQESTAQTQSEVSSKISLNYYLHTFKGRERKRERERDRTYMHTLHVHNNDFFTLFFIYISWEPDYILLFMFIFLSPLMPTKIMTDSMRFCFFFKSLPYIPYHIFKICVAICLHSRQQPTPITLKFGNSPLIFDLCGTDRYM